LTYAFKLDKQNGRERALNYTHEIISIITSVISIVTS